MQCPTNNNTSNSHLRYGIKELSIVKKKNVSEHCERCIGSIAYLFISFFFNIDQFNNIEKLFIKIKIFGGFNYNS